MARVRPLFLHIGASKTGTSSLQKGLFQSTTALAGTGLGIPLDSRRAHVRNILRPLGWRTSEGFVAEPKPRQLRKNAKDIAKVSGDQVLLTCEDLCEADPARIELLISSLRKVGFEPRVVLTLRNLGAVVPSEYQQFLKHRMTLTYSEFLEGIRNHSGRWANHFWQRQDAAAIAQRFAAEVGAENLDIIVTPDFKTDPGGLVRLFSQVVGFDPTLLKLPEGDVNASWGVVEAEVYRRTNLALGDRMPNYDKDYQEGLRWPLVKGVLPRKASSKFSVPLGDVAWIREEAIRQHSALVAGGYRISGDADSLIPSTDFGADVPEASDAEVAEAATQALANFAVFALQRQQRRIAGSK
jgi:hypothetical protein